MSLVTATKLEIRSCIGCQVTFSYTKTGGLIRLYCGEHCKNRFYRNVGVELIPKTTFKTSPFHGNRARRERGAAKLSLLKISCEHCGNHIPSAKRKSRRFCDAQCHWQAIGKHKDQKNVKHRSLMSKYGIPLSEYNRMASEQNSMCRICGEVGENLFVDHSHATGKVRGLLCNNCNAGLGMFRDNPEFLVSAISYLGETK